MTFVRRWRLQWLLIWMAWIWPLHVPAGPADVAAAEVVEIATGVYVRPGRTAMLFEADDVANAGFIVGERCVAVIDTGGSVAEGRALAAAIRRITEVEVCFVINTHVHPDHMLGNAAFQRDGVEFIGHEKLPQAMAMRGDIYLQRAAEFTGEEADMLQIVPPERVISRTLQLDLGRRMLTLRAHAAAHTDGDLSVLDEQTGTLFAGDLVFLEHVPVLDGSLNGWLEELAALMQERFSHVVPGHGPARVDWPQGGTPTVDYLAGLREAVRAWIAGGGDLGAAQQGIEATEPERWQLIERYHKRNVAAAFAELEWED